MKTPDAPTAGQTPTMTIERARQIESTLPKLTQEWIDGGPDPTLPYSPAEYDEARAVCFAAWMASL